MRVLFVLVILALLSVASAETIQFGNYTATFDMKQTHVIDSNSIRTFYGWVHFYEQPKSMPNITFQSIGMASFNNHTTKVFLESSDIYLIADDGILLESAMNLTSTLDFLKTLKIEKTKAT
jgi:hypothetical protein